MILTGITFTGIDEHTDLMRVEKIQARYPYAEFGVLFSLDWIYNGHRYPIPAIVLELERRKIRLSAHLCGKMAIQAAKGDFSPMEQTVGSAHAFDIFRRCQLNIQTGGLFDDLHRLDLSSTRLHEVIVQMHSAEQCEAFLKWGSPRKMAYLMDASGGRGIDAPVTVVDAPWIHTGYAGGIGPENVGAKLQALLDHPTDGRFWIDMETRVRTEDDWLDLDKVEQVLEICDPIIRKQQHDKNNERLWKRSR